MKTVPLLAIGLLALLTGNIPAAVSPESFSNPPAQFRILKIIHNWPDAPAQQDALIQRLTAQGFGGVVCNVSFQNYLQSEDKWSAFIRAVKTARQQGMAMWLYDERGYPSGNAGGLVLRDHPEWEAAGLLIADAQTQGAPISIEAPPGRLIQAAAFPLINGQISLRQKVDLSKLIASGKLNWQPPAGNWKVILITESRLYEGTHAAHNLHEHIPYPNLLQPEPTKRFIELTHQAYASRLGTNLGEWFMATFTDEPSLMSLYLSPMPYSCLPWSADFPATFKKRRGYDLMQWLPALVTDAGPEGMRARYDFWLTVGELVSENYFGQIQTWCAAHGLPSGGHLLFEESPTYQVASYGDFYRCIRRLGAPGIDCLTSLPPDVPWYIARLLASAGELSGRTLVMSETSDHIQHYRPKGDTRPRRQVSSAEIRGTCNRLFVGGVNCITSYYSFDGLDDAQLRELNEWIGRCSLMLRGGRHVADIAVIYPTESMWVRFRPSRHYCKNAPEAQHVAAVYLSAVESLFKNGLDYAVLDATAVADARVENGALVNGSARWRVIVLPMIDTLPLEAWQRLAAFVRSGGTVIALAALPENSEREFPSTSVKRLAASMFGNEPAALRVHAQPSGGGCIYLPPGTEALLPTVLERLMEPEIQILQPHQAASQTKPIRITHRRMDNHDVLFIANDSPEPWSGEIATRSTAPGELWDPETGKVAPISNPARIPLQLAQYDAVFLKFPSITPAKINRWQSGPLPELEITTLPTVAPVLAGGQYVEKELAQPEPQAAPGWRVVGRITRSQVDTFLFARIIYTTPPDLKGTQYLVLDTWTPNPKGAQPNLLAILREQDGSEYICDTGRPLGAAGKNRTFVPISRFKLAGWSKDENGQLDLSQVNEIRLGWGGHYGQEGDIVEFSFSAPSIVKGLQPPKKLE